MYLRDLVLCIWIDLQSEAAFGERTVDGGMMKSHPHSLHTPQTYMERRFHGNRFKKKYAA